jgi:release factor glutamine methyltransferase
MTLRQAYEEGIERLKEAGIEEAGLDAWYLLEYVTGINRATYFADSNQEMKGSHRATYQTLISERETRIPLQHLTGVQEFMGLEFRVNEHVLIPRQDTEILVETALEKINTKKPLRVLDMCTGSGCILLSVLSYGRKKCEITGVGVDVSDKALQVAKENARNLQVDAEWIESDLFSGVSEKFDMILSNHIFLRQL